MRLGEPLLCGLLFELHSILKTIQALLSNNLPKLVTYVNRFFRYDIAMAGVYADNDGVFIVLCAKGDAE